MNAKDGQIGRSVRRWAVLVALGLAAGCGEPESGRLQGYVEGEFVYVAAPLGGRLTTLSVHRGDHVEPGTPLFSLENVPETAARDEVARQLAEARSMLEDATKGRRPSELQSLEAQLRQVEVAEAFSLRELERQEALFRTKATSAEELDRARSRVDTDKQRIVQLRADLETARLGQRNDQIAAAQARVEALEAVLHRAEWNLSQKQQSSILAGEVTDTLYREGEWVGPERPVVVMLPPANIKVRTFVPEIRLGGIQRGEKVRVFVDGVAAPLEGTVSFISPRAEFTPPVVYSRTRREKMVFMVEAVFSLEQAPTLHPGQPVEVEFGP